MITETWILPRAMCLPYSSYYQNINFGMPIFEYPVIDCAIISCYRMRHRYFESCLREQGLRIA